MNFVSDSSRSEGNGWKVLAASVQGTSHRHEDVICQDANGWSILNDGTLVAVVADGAGSASSSAIGAKVAVECVLATVREGLNTAQPIGEDAWKAFMIRVLKAAVAAVTSRAELEALPIGQFASTLVVAVATPNVTVGAQIGDGAAVLEDDGNILSLTSPVFGEYLNETTFLVSAGAVDTAQISVAKPCERIAVISDGLQMLAMGVPEGIPHKPFFDPIFQFADKCTDSGAATDELATWLASPRVSERTSDDLTLLVAVRSH